jgi:hypothetical protein
MCGDSFSTRYRICLHNAEVRYTDIRPLVEMILTDTDYKMLLTTFRVA